jgi:hypothetical protein
LCRCHHPLHPPPLPLLLDQLPAGIMNQPPRVNKSFIYLLFIFFCCTLKRKHHSSLLFSRTWVSGGG